MKLGKKYWSKKLGVPEAELPDFLELLGTKKPTKADIKWATGVIEKYEER